MKLINPGKIEIIGVSLDRIPHVFDRGQKGHKFDRSYEAPRAVLRAKFHGQERRMVVTLERGLQDLWKLEDKRKESAA